MTERKDKRHRAIDLASAREQVERALAELDAFEFVAGEPAERLAGDIKIAVSPWLPDPGSDLISDPECTRGEQVVSIFERLPAEAKVVGGIPLLLIARETGRARFFRTTSGGKLHLRGLAQGRYSLRHVANLIKIEHDSELLAIVAGRLWSGSRRVVFESRRKSDGRLELVAVEPDECGKMLFRFRDASTARYVVLERESEDLILEELPAGEYHIDLVPGVVLNVKDRAAATEVGAQAEAGDHLSGFAGDFAIVIHVAGGSSTIEIRTAARRAEGLPLVIDPLLGSSRGLVLVRLETTRAEAVCEVVAALHVQAESGGGPLLRGSRALDLASILRDLRDRGLEELVATVEKLPLHQMLSATPGEGARWRALLDDALAAVPARGHGQRLLELALRLLDLGRRFEGRIRIEGEHLAARHAAPRLEYSAAAGPFECAVFRRAGNWYLAATLRPSTDYARELQSCMAWIPAGASLEVRVSSMGQEADSFDLALVPVEAWRGLGLLGELPLPAKAAAAVERGGELVLSIGLCFVAAQEGAVPAPLPATSEWAYEAAAEPALLGASMLGEERPARIRLPALGAAAWAGKLTAAEPEVLARIEQDGVEVRVLLVDAARIRFDLSTSATRPGLDPGPARGLEAALGFARLVIAPVDGKAPAGLVVPLLAEAGGACGSVYAVETEAIAGRELEVSVEILQPGQLVGLSAELRNRQLDEIEGSRDALERRDAVGREMLAALARSLRAATGGAGD